jgi:crotonobetainyl-CoA:carnitine CoA-transferase CaiB-like acyl-CoA transferase
MSITGDPDGEPYRLGLPIADMVAGLFAAQGITAALLERTRTHRGRHVDISMLDSVAALLTYQASAYFATGAIPGRFGNGHLSIVPYDTFMASDGQLMIAVGNDDQWRRLCAAAGLGDLAADPRFATNPQRVAHREALQPILDRVFRTRDRAAWLSLLDGAGVPCGEVRNIGETLADPQLAARGMIVAMQHPSAGAIRAVSSPIKMSGGPAEAGHYGTKEPGLAEAGHYGDIEPAPSPKPPPRLGEQTESILVTELGLSADDVRDLKAKAVI